MSISVLPPLDLPPILVGSFEHELTDHAEQRLSTPALVCGLLVAGTWDFRVSPESRDPYVAATRMKPRDQNPVADPVSPMVFREEPVALRRCRPANTVSALEHYRFILST